MDCIRIRTGFVGPDMETTFGVEPAPPGGGGSPVVVTALVLDNLDFEVLNITSKRTPNTPLLTGKIVPTPDGEKWRITLVPTIFRAGEFVLINAVNKSFGDDSASFSASLVCREPTAAELGVAGRESGEESAAGLGEGTGDPDPKASSIFDRCLSWFQEGIAAAVVDSALAGGRRSRPGRLSLLRDAVVNYVAAVLDEASRGIGARQGVTSGESLGRKIGSLGIPTVVVKGGEKAVLKLGATRWCVPRRLRLNQDVFRILSVQAGEDDLLRGSSFVVPEGFAGQGIWLSAVGRAIAPGTFIEIVVQSVAGDQVAVGGLLECELYDECPDET